MVLECEWYQAGNWMTAPIVYCPVQPSTEGAPAWPTTAAPVVNVPRAAPRHGGGRRTSVVYYDGHTAGVAWDDLNANTDDVWGHVNP
jgi:prepilin-type processing-associated H-X9-DG protein